jgi:DNA-binding Xre family transcriptional regulator
LRWQAEAGDIRFDEYLSKGQGWIDFTESHVAAARLVLQTTAEELWKLGLPRREFREAMENQIEGAVYSLELRGHQKLAIETEFGALWTAPPESIQRTPTAASPIPTASGTRRKHGRPAGKFSESGRKRVETYCSNLPRKREQLAEKAGISSKSIDRLMSGEAISNDSWNKLAKAMGITPDELIKA